jgi:cell division protease FtsH
MVSIIPSGRSLGRAWLADTHDRVVHSRSALIDEMAILLGGRCAEQLVAGHAGSSALGDLAAVGRIAHQMVRELGMSEQLGPIGYPEGADENGPPLTVSDDTARLIDAEARKLVDEAQGRAEAILRASRTALDELTTALLTSETLTAAQIETIVGRAQQTAAPTF